MPATLRISLAAARVNANMTQQEVADKMQISKAKVIGWEKGRLKISPAELFYLANLYQIPIDNIILP